MFRRYQRSHTSSALNCEERAQRECDILNATEGLLQDYDCPACHNKGYVYFVAEDNEVCSRSCDCMPLRRSVERIRSSGLQRLMEIYTLDRFQTKTALQKEMKATARRFLENYAQEKGWLFVGGQSGAGKSHLCTAVSCELLRQGVALRYMLWKDESTKIKAVVNNDEEYSLLVSPLKAMPVLYIDDLFKPVIDDSGKRRQPSPGDISLAFEIINARYIAGLVTIISSEWTMDELQRVDAAIGGRIYQMAEKYCLVISPGEEKNYRLKGSQHNGY